MVEFQRIARRDKKGFFNDQCKEIQENNTMGKIRDLVKKIRDTKGISHAKMGSIKDRNCRDLTEPTGIKIAGRNINNLRYADDTTLVAESEEELKNLLRNVNYISQF